LSEAFEAIGWFLAHSVWMVACAYLGGIGAYARIATVAAREAKAKALKGKAEAAESAAGKFVEAAINRHLGNAISQSIARGRKRAEVRHAAKEKRDDDPTEH